MTDFAAIADAAVAIIGSADPAQFQTAYDTMSVQTQAVDRESFPTEEMFAIILDNVSEWEAMPGDDRQIVRDILVIHANGGVPTSVGSPARTILVDKLGTNTKQALAAALPETVALFPGLTPGQVSDALNMRAAGDV